MDVEPLEFEDEPRHFLDERHAAEAFANGEAFRFFSFEFDDEGVGVVEGEMPVVIMVHGLNGLCMTRDTARKLGEALIEAAKGRMTDDDEDWTEEPDHD